jgi:hypothetical protein
MIAAMRRAAKQLRKREADKVTQHAIREAQRTAQAVRYQVEALCI